MSIQYSSFIDSLAFDATAENKPTLEELQANLSLWTNTQFTFDSLEKSGIQPSLTYSSPSSSSSTMNSPNSITYENLANYLDFELPQQHLLAEKSKSMFKAMPPLASAPTLAQDNTQLIKPKESNKERPAIEEEKRKRNTAASARFRIKKKQKEQLMEKAVQDMSEKSKNLENYVQELESEIKFLKGLLLEKDTCKSLFEETSQDASESEKE